LHILLNVLLYVASHTQSTRLEDCVEACGFHIVKSYVST